MTGADHKTSISYRSYLLRLWLEEAVEDPAWRIALIDPQTGERRGFSDFEHLVNFLMKEMLGGLEPSVKE